MATQDELLAYLAAYRAWQAAAAEWHRKIEAASQGVRLDAEPFRRETAELDRLHKDWMAKSLPLIGGTKH